MVFKCLSSFPYWKPAFLLMYIPHFLTHWIVSIWQSEFSGIRPSTSSAELANMQWPRVLRCQFPSRIVTWQWMSMEKIDPFMIGLWLLWNPLQRLVRRWTKLWRSCEEGITETATIARNWFLFFLQLFGSDSVRRLWSKHNKASSPNSRIDVEYFLASPNGEKVSLL